MNRTKSLTKNGNAVFSRRESQSQIEPAAERAAYRRGGRVLIRSQDLSNPTAQPAVGFLFLTAKSNETEF
jgi:hypothetical protein